MTEFVTAVGAGVVGAIAVVAVGELTTGLLLRRKRLRFPHGIPRVRDWDADWNEIGRDR